jgi:hypothetical protein
VAAGRNNFFETADFADSWDYWFKSAFRRGASKKKMRKIRVIRVIRGCSTLRTDFGFRTRAQIRRTEIVVVGKSAMEVGGGGAAGGSLVSAPPCFEILKV